MPLIKEYTRNYSPEVHLNSHKLSFFLQLKDGLELLFVDCSPFSATCLGVSRVSLLWVSDIDTITLLDKYYTINNLLETMWG